MTSDFRSPTQKSCRASGSAACTTPTKIIIEHTITEIQPLQVAPVPLVDANAIASGRSNNFHGNLLIQFSSAMECDPNAAAVRLESSDEPTVEL